MTRSAFEVVLGADLARLPEPLRTHVSAGAGVGHGVFESAGCTRPVLRPLLHTMARQRILFPDFGSDVPFRITNTSTPNGGLHAVRTFRFLSGDRRLEDTLRIVDGHLHDFMGRRNGFEVRMLVTADSGGLHLRSDRQWVHIGRGRVPVPRLATVTVHDSVVGGRRRIDVRLCSPLLGEWFHYVGMFDYGTETSLRPAR